MAAKISLPTIAALPANASARERILTAAVELLHTEGFAALTQQAVAAKAGMRQSHITYYFPTRNDLLRATAQYGCECMLAPIEGAAATGQLTPDALREILLPDESDRAFFRLMSSLVTACDEDESIKAWLNEFDTGVEKRIQGTFAMVGVMVPDDIVHLMHACFIGSVHLDSAWQTEASLAKARKNVAMLVDFVLREYAVKPVQPNLAIDKRQKTATQNHLKADQPASGTVPLKVQSVYQARKKTR
jgi:AcrR family transcriptional regulator